MRGVPVSSEGASHTVDRHCRKRTPTLSVVQSDPTSISRANRLRGTYIACVACLLGSGVNFGPINMTDPKPIKMSESGDELEDADDRVLEDDDDDWLE